MKISIVTGFFLPIPPVRGGATEKIWYRLAKVFVEQGHEVVFVSRQWPGFPVAEIEAGIRHVRVKGADHTRYLPLNLIHDFIYGLRVARVLPTADVAVLNAVALPAWLGTFKRRAGKVVAVVARMPKGQGVVYGRVDLILALSAAVAANLSAENPKLAARIRPFPFPIDWKLHAAARAQRAAQPTLTIGYIGRLHPEKGIPLLLAACARLAADRALPAWRLKLVGPSAVPSGGGGDAWLASILAPHAEALKDRLAVVPPEFDPVKLAAHYAAIDVFAYPSLAEKGETFGVAVAEAMAARGAAVVSGLACFNELVTDGKTGLVFEHSAADAAERLSACLRSLLVDGNRREAIAGAGQEWVKQFDFEAVAKTVLADFASVAPQTAKGE